MTYNKFEKVMLEDKELGLESKALKKFALNYGMVMAVEAVCISAVIAKILTSSFAWLFLVIALLLYVFTFDVVAEDKALFGKMSRVLKFRWLIAAASVVSAVAVCLFLV